MKIFRRLFHPLITFIGLQILWILVLLFWIYWFLGRHQQFKEFAARYQAEWLPETTDWLILTEGILLLVAILIGIYVIFLFWRRQAALYRAQQHFINQVTHELKSPLASIQLHLETIQLRPPTPEQLQHFVTLMQADSDRLHSLINNLLTAGRIEHKGAQLNLQPGDLSAFIEVYLTKEKHSFPAAGQLTWSLESGLWALFEEETMAMVLRNLLENAQLYANGPPQVKIDLKRDGEMAHLTFADQGQGIPTSYQKKVFRMFYRIRQGEKNVRGSGLGLFIVRSVIRMHGGKVWINSPGRNAGTTFHLLIPLQRKESAHG
jgi:signal transduction histidine kinase